MDRNIKDVDSIVNQILFGSFTNSGQFCISIQRILIHESLYDEFCEKLQKGAEKWNLNQGDPFNRSTMLGPLISEKEAIRVEDWVNQSVSDNGGKILCGGTRNGSFYGKFILIIQRNN